MTQSSLLITQCLQNDFVQPLNKFDPLPNALHIGYKEALRLVGEQPSEGPVATLMEWAYATPEEQLSIFHIRDWHDANDLTQSEHLKQFGIHCIKDTKGAEFIFENFIHAKRKSSVVNASGLNDFNATTLGELLAPFKGQKIKVGIVGVWTEAKISFLAYELATRYPEFELAVCSALTASSSTTMHFIALDQLKSILGIHVFESIGDFTNFLNGTLPAIQHRLNNRVDTSHFKFDKDTLLETDKRLLNYLFRDAKEASFVVLDGGFSGNVVLKAKAWDSLGHQQVPTVVKIGRRDLVSKERTSFERIEEILGNTAPRIVDFAEEAERGAIKYRYAAMLDEKVTSFQKFYAKTNEVNNIASVLDVVFEKQLGRLYKAGKSEKLNLLTYYDFSTKYAGSVRKKVETLLEKPVKGDTISIEGRVVYNVCNFYETDLLSLSEYVQSSHYVSYVHGDLNGANIIIDAQENVWIIDFFHTQQGHILKDLIKLENDLLFIFTSIQSESELNEMLHLLDILLEVKDISLPPFEFNETPFGYPQFAKALAVVKQLRSYYAPLIHLDKDPYQYHIAMLRYAMHTLSFDECNDFQKKAALYMGCKCSERVKNYLENAKRLRIDFVSSKDISLQCEGSIGLTILPGRKDRGRDIKQDIQALKANGIQSIVCLLSENEFEHYGVESLKEEYKKAGFSVKYCSIIDQSVPTKEQMNSLIDWIEVERNENKKLVIHCVGGIGRTGTLAACYLIKKEGMLAYDAIKVVRSSRSPRAIENEVQENFVKTFK